MSRQPPGYQRLFAELKRRKVFRVAAVYGATAFVLVQAADLTFVRFGLPAWTVTFLILVAVFGFPIALVLAWAFETTPEGVRRTEAAAPEEVERIVAQPAWKRWPSGLLALVGIGLLVAGAWFAGWRSGSAGAAEAEAREASIAVLPFADLSPEGDQEHFSDGIAEELLNLLARVPELRVAARTSSFAFEEEDLPIPVIADSLNVAHVLEGSVRKAGRQVRITAQLIRAEDGYHVWSESWDRTLEDVFGVQDEIAAEVVDRLQVTLLDETPTVEETDPEAYALVLRARHLSDRGSADDLDAAERLYREALSIDSTYAAGWSGLASNYVRQARVEGYSKALPRARAAARRALALEPAHAPAHSILGLLATSEGNLAAAAHHHERALELAPGDATAVGQANLLLVSLGRLQEAIRLAEYVVARDPVNATGHLNLGLTYYGARRWDDAVEALRTARTLAPDLGGVHAFLGQALIRAGQTASGLAAIREERAEHFRLIGEAIAYHSLDRPDESDAALAALIEGYERQAAFNIAYVVAFRGEVDRAFRWLDRAVDYEDPGLLEIFARPEFEALEDDPRWDDFLERIGKSPEELGGVEFEVELPGEAAPGSSGS